MPPALVLDKSYLDGAPTSSIRQLCRDRTVLCSETLFYELMTTSPSSQIRCFSKFPEEAGAFALLPNVGELLRVEMESRSPCGSIHQHVIPGSYIFNAQLRAGTYVPPGNVLATMSTWRAQVQADVKAFLERCQSVHQFFPELVGIEFRDFPAAVADAKDRISNGPDTVRAVYASFDREALPAKAPQPDEIDPSWAWYRWVQCQLFAALRLFERYQCKIPVDPSPGVLERAEHSMHDLEYVLLGALVGSIASNDEEVVEDFRLANPAGTVITTRAK